MREISSDVAVLVASGSRRISKNITSAAGFLTFLALNVRQRCAPPGRLRKHITSEHGQGTPFPLHLTQYFEGAQTGALVAETPGATRGAIPDGPIAPETYVLLLFSYRFGTPCMLTTCAAGTTPKQHHNHAQVEK